MLDSQSASSKASVCWFSARSDNKWQNSKIYWELFSIIIISVIEIPVCWLSLRSEAMWQNRPLKYISCYSTLNQYSTLLHLVKRIIVKRIEIPKCIVTKHGPFSHVGISHLRRNSWSMIAELQCGENEIYLRCGNHCEEKCKNAYRPKELCLAYCSSPACACKNGYFRHEGKCLKIADCPSEWTYAVNNDVGPFVNRTSFYRHVHVCIVQGFWCKLTKSIIYQSILINQSTILTKLHRIHQHHRDPPYADLRCDQMEGNSKMDNLSINIDQLIDNFCRSWWLFTTSCTLSHSE